MITDLRTSINSILYQRVTSPLFGTFVISWLVWNWKIFYASFIIDSDKITNNRIDYIVENFNDINYLIWFPLISTLILITIVPFISNGAYFLSLKFEQWRIDNKNKIERKQLLTLEQSIQLRQQLLDYEKKFESLLSKKDKEIKELNLLIEKTSNDEKPNSKLIEVGSNEEIEEKSAIELYNRIINNEKLHNAFHLVSEYLQKGLTDLTLNQNLSSKSISFFESNDIVEHNGKGTYKLTKKGKRIKQLLFDLDFA
ncbi:hypothetical protein [Gillisia sp. JM1]|uniref:hypothetical protein n=1 Tax=Gillisia sp. JM1 TaxID=1283286 RepID=UPI0003F921F8|nr:hypothetical protein [Gillisia sp. JM1]